MALGFGGQTGKKKKSKKGGIPQEVVDKILNMPPADLALELSREQLAIDQIKEDMQEDADLKKARDRVEEIKEEADKQPKVAKAKTEYLDAKEEELDQTEGYEEAKLDLRLARSEWNRDLKPIRERIKLIKKTMKHHLESGALKFKD